MDLSLHFSMAELFKTFIAFLVMINPPAVLPIFLTLTQGATKEQLQKINALASKSVFMVLTISAVLGELILKAANISIPAFQISGGILLAYIAFGMITSKDEQHSQTESEKEQALLKKTSNPLGIAVVPLTIPLLTGPGSMTLSVITASKYHSLDGYLYIILSAAIIAFITYFTFQSAGKIEKILGSNGMSVMGKVLGVILMAMGIELILAGYRGAF